MTRRKFFYNFANFSAAIGCYLVSPFQKKSFFLWKTEDEMQILYQNIFQNIDSAIRLGEIYVRNLEKYTSRQEMCRLIFEGKLYKHRECDNRWMNDCDYLKKIIVEQIRMDFKKDDIAVIDGWVMSRTELRLCAIAYIDHISPS